MTRLRLLAGGLAFAFWSVLGTPAQAFVSMQVSTWTAQATVGGLLITAQPLPPEALFGANVVVPVEVTPVGTDPASLNSLQVDIVYQLIGPAGAALTSPASLPGRFTAHPTKPRTAHGAAVIPRSQLEPIRRGGRLDYVFRAPQGLNSMVLGAGGLSQVPEGQPFFTQPFQTQIIDQWCGPVSPAGARVSAPDLYEADGRTSVGLGRGSVASPDVLCIRQEDVEGWPPGPRGNKPAAVYSIALDKTTLAAPAELVLSYPADLDGRVTGMGIPGSDLSIYWLGDDRRPLINRQWRALSRPRVDTVLHTVTATTPHLSVFGLFAGGVTGAPLFRPTERIITPNNDGVNDTAAFSGLGAQDEVKIFDARGRRVRTLRGPSPVWDGRDDEGDIVESGVYLYQYQSEGDVVSGVIAVAK